MGMKKVDKKSGENDKNKFLNFFKKLSKKQKITGIIVFVVIILLAIGIPVVVNTILRMNYERDYPIVATREDFIGKTFVEAKKSADEKGIRYDIDNLGIGIYDWESEDIQIVDWITSVYDEKDNFVREYNRYTSHGFELRKGWRISMGTDVKTEKQKADEEVCKAKEGYTFTYKDGKVDCHKTQETLCKEKGGIWNNSKCKTQEEIEAEEKAKEEEEERKKQEEADKKAEEERNAKEEEEKKANEEQKSSDSSSSSSSSSSDPSNSQAIWANPKAHKGETVTLTGSIRVDYAWYKYIDSYKKEDKWIPFNSTNYAFWIQTSNGTAYVMGGQSFGKDVDNGDTITITGKVVSDDSTGDQLWVEIP